MPAKPRQSAPAAAPPEKPAEAKPATYSAETPWLCWVKWAKAQHYRAANPPWFRAFTSIWTEAKYREVWAPHGDRAAALLFRLTHHLAVRSRVGVVWGDPVALQRELGMTEPPDLSWLLAAGWCSYITDDEKCRREREADEPKTKTRARKGPVPKTPPAPSAAPPVDATREAGAAAWLARNPAMRAADLAAQLGCSVWAVYRLAAWRRRKEFTAKTANVQAVGAKNASGKQPSRSENDALPAQLAQCSEESRAEESRVEQSRAEETTRSSASARVPTARAPLRVPGSDVAEPAEPAEQSTAEQGTAEQGTGQEGRQGPEKPEPANPHEPEAFAAGEASASASRQGGQQATGLVEPHEPEAGGVPGPRRTRRPSGPSRTSLRGGEARPIGHVLGGRCPWWDDPEAVAFGEDMFGRLWPGRARDSRDADSEVGTFAKLFFERVRVEVPGLERARFHVRARERAEHIRKHHKGARRRGAALMARIKEDLLGGGGARASPGRC